MSTPNLMLKVIVLTHFILSAWGTMGSWLPNTYFYVHIVFFICGVWAIASNESLDAVQMMLVVLLFSILQDVILLSLYQPRGYRTYEDEIVRYDSLNEWRFALGMCITNLILKPVTCFLLFRIYQARGNQADFSIPGIDRLPIPGLGGLGGGGGYEDMDHKQTSGPHSSVSVESATPHRTVDHTQDRE